MAINNNAEKLLGVIHCITTPVLTICSAVIVHTMIIGSYEKIVSVKVTSCSQI